MAVTYFPFNSIMVGGVPDRAANAESLAAYLAGFFSNGVLMQDDTALQVSASSGMSVQIAAGVGNINGKTIHNDAAEIITLEAASATLDRIDRIIFRLNETDRLMEFAVLKGTPASSPAAPALTQDANIYELCLAEVRIPAGATSITSSYITDTRKNETLCGVSEIAPHLQGIAEGGTDADNAEDARKNLGAISEEELNSAVNEVQGNIDNIKIGGRNLVLKSSAEKSSSADKVAEYNVSEFLEARKEYTVTICITPAEGVTTCDMYLSNSWQRNCSFAVNGTEKQIISKTFKAAYYRDKTPDADAKNAKPTFYRYPTDGTVTGATTIHWVKIERGNKATDWTPAPEDMCSFSDTFIKSGSSAKAGLVPAPSTTEDNIKYLCEDGTWKKPLNRTLLWSNADTSSVFAPQTFSNLAGGKYDYVEIEFKHSTSLGQYSTITIRKGTVGQIQILNNYSTSDNDVYMYTRNILVNSEGTVDFYDVYRKIITNKSAISGATDYLIPTKIYGLS